MWWETSGGLHTEWVPAPRMRRFGFEGLWESSGQCLCLWSVSTTLLWEDETCLTGLWNNLYHLIFRTRELCHKVSLWTNLDHFILCFQPICLWAKLQSLEAQSSRLPSLWTLSSSLGPCQNHCQVWGCARRTHGTQWRPQHSQLRCITGRGDRLKSAEGRDTGLSPGQLSGVLCPVESGWTASSPPKYWCVTLCMEYCQPGMLTWVFIGASLYRHDWWIDLPCG